MILSTLELHHIKQSLFDKTIYGHGNTAAYTKLYDKVSNELNSRQNPIKSVIRGPIEVIKWPVDKP